MLGMERENLLLSGLLVTQNALRDVKQIGGMMEHITTNGRWTKDVLSAWDDTNNNLISIVEFPNGIQAIHDGHHRCVATLLAKRAHLFPSEYELCHRSYEDYIHANLDAGWITPFNPKTEVRVADFQEFKDFVHRLLDIDSAVRYILRHKDLYACPRDIYTLDELAHLCADNYLRNLEEYERTRIRRK